MRNVKLITFNWKVKCILDTKGTRQSIYLRNIFRKSSLDFGGSATEVVGLSVDDESPEDVVGQLPGPRWSARGMNESWEWACDRLEENKYTSNCGMWLNDE